MGYTRADRASRLLDEPAAIDLPTHPPPSSSRRASCIRRTFASATHAAHSSSRTSQSPHRRVATALEDDLPAHTGVLRRFGRYPHRNHLKRRALPEEARWLVSDDCPGWAKSPSHRDPSSSRESTREAPR